jgi:hypothetical protein
MCVSINSEYAAKIYINELLRKGNYGIRHAKSFLDTCQSYHKWLIGYEICDNKLQKKFVVTGKPGLEIIEGAILITPKKKELEPV